MRNKFCLAVSSLAFAVISIFRANTALGQEYSKEQLEAMSRIELVNVALDLQQRLAARVHATCKIRFKCV